MATDTSTTLQPEMIALSQATAIVAQQVRTDLKNADFTSAEIATMIGPIVAAIIAASHNSDVHLQTVVKRIVKQPA